MEGWWCGAGKKSKWIVSLLRMPWKARDDDDSHEVAPSGLAHATPTVVSAGVTATASNHCWPLIPRMQLAFLFHPSCSTVENVKKKKKKHPPIYLLFSVISVKLKKFLKIWPEVCCERERVQNPDLKKSVELNNNTTAERTSQQWIFRVRYFFVTVVLEQTKGKAHLQELLLPHIKMPRLRCSQSTPHLFSPAMRLTQISFCSPLAAAANQREALKSPFHLKEEPKVEEALSPRPASRSQSQVQPCFAGAFSQDGPAAGAAAAAAERPLLVKPREGSPMAKNSLLSQDINMKVASELLIKLSGKESTEILTYKSNEKPLVHISQKIQVRHLEKKEIECLLTSGWNQEGDVLPSPTNKKVFSFISSSVEEVLDNIC